MHILNYDVELRSIAESNIQQAFVDILDNEVIKPLASLKASRGLLVRANNLIIGLSGRKRIEEDLKRSAANYADFAENSILVLQQAYFKKYHPR